MKENAATKEETTQMQEGRITEEGLDKLRKLIGTELRINNIFNQLSSREAIRNFVNGIGDPNPIYRDEDYAGTTRYKSIIAPPSWFYSVFPTWVSIGLPGVHGFHSGTDWEFMKPIYVGDTIRPVCVLSDVKVKESKFATKIAILYYDSKFYNQRGELLARSNAWSIRAERHTARKKGKYSEITLPHPWKEEELKKIEEEVSGG